MTDIDTMVREFRASLAEPRMAPADELARRAAEQAPRRVRRVGRLVAIGAGGVATAGLATVLSVLFLAGGSGSGIHQASAPRVAWGQLITLRVTTDDKANQPALMNRVAELIVQHAEATHRPGIRVEEIDAEHLQVTAPGAKWEADVTAAIPSFFGIAAFEPDAVEGTGKVLDDFEKFADPAPGPDTAWAVGPGRPDLQGVIIVDDRVEAEAYGKSLGNADLLPLRSNHRILVRVPGQPGQPPVDDPLILTSREPAVDDDDITAIRFDGSNLVVDIRESSRAEVSDALRRHADAAASWPVVMTVGPEMRSAPLVLGFVSVSDSAPDGSRVVVKPDHDSARGTAEQVAGGPFIPGQAVVESTASYGQIPLLAGERVQLPDWLERDRQRVLDYADGGVVARFHEIPAESIVKVLAVSGPIGEREVWAGRAPDGTDAFWLTFDGRQDQLGACDPGLGAPIAQGCGGGASGQDMTALGRVGPEVASVERIAEDGSVTVGTVAFGWYLIAWRSEPGEIARQPVLVAKDASGKVIARSDNGSPNWAPVP